MNKKGIEFSFSWIFALIVGAMILALAIYGVSNFIGTERKIGDSSRGVELSALLRELETGLEQQGTAKIDAVTNTRITNNCTANGRTASEKIFGLQQLKTSTPSRIGKKFEENGIPLSSSSIYIFSDKIIEGDEFITISQSFELPFKVADVISIWPASEKYCFVNTPNEIRKNAENLNIAGVNFTATVNQCIKNSKKICFTQRGCDIDVSTQTKTVTKNLKTVYYDSENSALFYAAIFSDKDIYDCQLKRLLSRASVLAKIYADKASIGTNYGCSAANLASFMKTFSSQLSNIKNSDQLSQLSQIITEVKDTNNALACRQF